MNKQFGEIVSKLGLPASIAQEIAEAWDAQIAAAKEELKTELHESAGDTSYVVAAADTILRETLEAHKAEMESERKAIAEQKAYALAKVKKAKQLHEAAKRKALAESVAIENVTALVLDVLAEEIKELRADREELANSVAAEKVALLKERMKATKIAENQAKAASLMVNSVLEAEIKELHADRQENKKVLEANLAKMSEMMEGVLAEEIKELHEDRELMMESVKKLEDLTIRQLTEELSEFQEDRRALEEERVRLVMESNRQIAEFKEEFVAKASDTAARVVNEELNRSLSALRKDLKEAQENTFGRRIFETFAAEFATSAFGQNKTTEKLLRKLEESNKNIEIMQKIIEDKSNLLNNKEKELTEAVQIAKREKTLASLTASLGGVQKSMMTHLLEGVKTENLEKAFNRYLPQVLDRKVEQRKLVTESAASTAHLKETNGNRVQHQPVVAKEPQVDEVSEADDDIKSIITAAGL